MKDDAEKMPVYADLAQIMKNYRRAMEKRTGKRLLSQIASSIGISSCLLSKYELGERKIQFDLFWRWCVALDVKPHSVCSKIWEMEHPRSHTSKKKQLDRLLAKPFAELTDEELKFIAENRKEGTNAGTFADNH